LYLHLYYRKGIGEAKENQSEDVNMASTQKKGDPPLRGIRGHFYAGKTRQNLREGSGEKKFLFPQVGQSITERGKSIRRRALGTSGGGLAALEGKIVQKGGPGHACTNLEEGSIGTPAAERLIPAQKGEVALFSEGGCGKLQRRERGISKS